MTSQIVLHLPSFTETLVVYGRGTEADRESAGVTGEVVTSRVAGERYMSVIEGRVSKQQVSGSVATAVTADVRVVRVTAERRLDGN